MPQPTSSQYNEALQNPRVNLVDPELQSGRVELKRDGRPRPRSGTYGEVYKVESGTQRQWAVKVFNGLLAQDQQSRFAEIGQQLNTAQLPYTVGFQYQPRGIRVTGQLYPILKMEWVEGTALNQYVEANLDNPVTLTTFTYRWFQMVRALESKSIAHGDLQHGNVLILSNGDIKLVDYDGMYVAALNRRKGNEIGQENYQHPRRSPSDFGPYMDRFSSWVIYFSILALSIDPSLWRKVKNAGDDALLFRKSDYVAPFVSDTFKLLCNHGSSQISSLARKIQSFCSLTDCSKIPVVEDAYVAQPTGYTPQLSTGAMASAVVDWPVQQSGVYSHTQTSTVSSHTGTQYVNPVSTSTAWPQNAGATTIKCKYCGHDNLIDEIYCQNPACTRPNKDEGLHGLQRCRYCNKDIVAKARVCPKCGSKNP